MLQTSARVEEGHIRDIGWGWQRSLAVLAPDYKGSTSLRSTFCQQVDGRRIEGRRTHWAFLVKLKIEMF
jgi:hypothetical protein